MDIPPSDQNVSRETGVPPWGMTRRAYRTKGRLAAQADIKAALERLLNDPGHTWNDAFRYGYEAEVSRQLGRL